MISTEYEYFVERRKGEYSILMSPYRLRDGEPQKAIKIPETNIINCFNMLKALREEHKYTKTGNRLTRLVEKIEGEYFLVSTLTNKDSKSIEIRRTSEYALRMAIDFIDKQREKENNEN